MGRMKDPVRGKTKTVPRTCSLHLVYDELLADNMEGASGGQILRMLAFPLLDLAMV
jgi:hypothetical protein